MKRNGWVRILCLVLVLLMAVGSFLGIFLSLFFY